MKSSSQIQAAIDIGTNTILLLVAEVEEVGAGSDLSPYAVKRRIVKVLDHQIRFARLGQGVHQNRVFHPEAMERALNIFQEYAALCKFNDVQKIYAVATSASRDASNSSEFYKKVFALTGIQVQIISGEQEASLSFRGGLLPDQNPNECAILDIGGGSTEFVTLKAGTSHVEGQSLDIGSVRATELFLKGDPYTQASISDLENHLKQIYNSIALPIQRQLKEKTWVAIAGTPTALAGMYLNLQSFDSERVDGFCLDRCSVSDYFEKLALMSQKQREAEPMLGKGRADVMVAGVGILLTAMEYFDKSEVIVSSRGLREGILMSL